MDHEELWHRIRYRKGYMVAKLTNSGESAPARYSITFIRKEDEELIVRCDADPKQIGEGSHAMLEVWGPDALYRFEGSVEKILPKQHGVFILVVRVVDMDAVQRRSTERYDTYIPTTFRPVTGATEEQASPMGRHAVGHATNIGLGGMQLRTEYDMPLGVALFFNVAAPGGALLVHGRIVNKRRTATHGYTYGIEYTDFDDLTFHRLNRMVRKIEAADNRRRRSFQSITPAATRLTAGSARRRRILRGRREWS